MFGFVADGRDRWHLALEQRALEWFAVELDRSGWWRRQVILWRIRRLVRASIRRNEPSAWTLW